MKNNNSIYMYTYYIHFFFFKKGEKLNTGSLRIFFFSNKFSILVNYHF